MLKCIINFFFYIIVTFILIALISLNDEKEIDKKTNTKGRIKTAKEKGYISKEYFEKIPKCSPFCGVAIKGWYNAKEYCHQRNSLLVSRSQIKKIIKGKLDACLDCNYWTNTEVLVNEKKSKVYIYLNFEDDFLDYSKDDVYIATCLSD